MLNILLLLIIIGCVIALANWRWGIAMAVVVGLLQDPLRKMVPGIPGFLAMASAPVWLATMASAAFADQLRIQRFFACFPKLARWALMWLAYLAVPAILSATYGHNSWMIMILGAFVYGAMFLALVAGWGYPDARHRTHRVLIFYVAGASLLLVGGLLDAWGWGERFAAIGTEAMGNVWVTHRTGAAVYMLAGFFRGPDIMGWHAALVLMVSIIMAFRSRGVVRWIWIAVAIWGLLNVWLCGRRKMLSMIPVFMGCYLFLIFRFKNARRFVSIAGTVIMIAGVGWHVISLYQRNEAVEAFYLSAFTEVGDQLQRHGIESVMGTVEQAGFWGYGLGMSQQGVHHIPAETPKLWQESGPGKLVAEFGVLGALLTLCLGVVFIKTAYLVVCQSRRDDSFYFTAGLFSILAANMTSALVSAQIYGDMFIALFLAFMAGLLLAAVRAPAEPGRAS